jgi:DNA-binding NarL/FixJ family response regulator
LPDTPVSLSGREREIAALIADGRTNWQIAERPAVSPRPCREMSGASSGKLGLSRCTELAAWMWRQAPAWQVSGRSSAAVRLTC